MREDILSTKLEKINNLRQAGMEVYPERSWRDFQIGEVLDKFKTIKKEVSLTGRIRSLRPMGGSVFSHIEDESGKIQLFLNKKNIDKESFVLFTKNIEMGDFVEARGVLFETKKKERTLDVREWKILSKNLRPLPTEHFGIKDEEELLRRRYLDLLVNPQTKELFRKKNIFWQTVRNFFISKGFLEVQTPVLEHIPGGADAEPFVTHHNALGQDFYLRISLELPLKRLLVGGYEKVFEIGRLFRNEGIDREHLQEYDDIEFYWAYADSSMGMKLIEEMFREIVFKVTKGYTTKYEEFTIDWKKKFAHVDYFTEFKKETGIDLGEEISAEDLKKKAKQLGIKYEESYGKGRMIDTIYKKTVRQKLIQPCFLTGHPIEVSPLAKKDPNNPKKVLRVQVVAGRAELCNAYSELNDPIDQRQRFQEQMKMREAGDSEAQMLDEDFIQALEYGMPPAFGFGMSERLFAFLMNKSIRETVIFPPMKAKEENKNTNKRTKIAAVILNKESKLEPWQKMNTVAHLNASFAARHGQELFLEDTITTKDHEKIKLNIRHAIMIKEASSGDIFNAMEQARGKGLEVFEFTREMIETTNDKKVIEQTKQKNFQDLDYLGILIFGDKSQVDEVTKEFALHK